MIEKPALSFPVIVMNVPAKGFITTLKADKRELKALAENHGLEEISQFEAELHISQWKKNGIRIRGTIVADYVQQCIASLEPIPAHMNEKVDTILVPENSRLAKVQYNDSGEIVLNADGPDIPEVFSGDSVDIGEIAEEFFELALDPYPRKAGLDDSQLNTTFGDIDDGNEKPVSPFAKLADLKRKS